MILVTGAGGKTGQAIIAALADRKVAVRALVRGRKLIPGATEVVVGDMESDAASATAVWPQALDGITKIYHICPNMHPLEVEIGRWLLAAAKKVGVKQFVYHSVLHPQIEAMPHHWRKMQVEALVFASGIPNSILQPTAYMQNIQGQWTTIQETGRLAAPYPVDAPISLVDLRDVAEVAARVLTEEGHIGATYELVGTAALTQTAVSQQLSEVSGRSITAHEVPLKKWHQNALADGLPPDKVEMLSQMFRYYATHGLVGNPTVLTHLLGRQPTSLKECAQSWGYAE